MHRGLAQRVLDETRERDPARRSCRLARRSTAPPPRMRAAVVDDIRAQPAATDFASLSVALQAVRRLAVGRDGDALLPRRHDVRAARRARAGAGERRGADPRAGRGHRRRRRLGPGHGRRSSRRSSRRRRCPVRFVTPAARRASAPAACAMPRSRAHRCDYVLLLDGDMVLHPQFVADHVALPRDRLLQPGRAHSARRGARRARLLAAGAGMPGAARARAGGLRRTLRAARRPALPAPLRRAANALRRHQVLQPGLLARRPAAANGFDEDMRGLGLGGQGTLRPARATRASAGRRCCSPRSPATSTTRRRPAVRRPRNRARWRETVRTGRTRCDAGIDRHRPLTRIAAFPSGRGPGRVAIRVTSPSLDANIMSTGKLVLLRHGQSIWNLENLFTGLDRRRPVRAGPARRRRRPGGC